MKINSTSSPLLSPRFSQYCNLPFQKIYYLHMTQPIQIQEPTTNELSFLPLLVLLNDITRKSVALSTLVEWYYLFKWMTLLINQLHNTSGSHKCYSWYINPSFMVIFLDRINGFIIYFYGRLICCGTCLINTYFTNVIFKNI